MIMTEHNNKDNCITKSGTMKMHSIVIYDTRLTNDEITILGVELLFSLIKAIYQEE